MPEATKMNDVPDSVDEPLPVADDPGGAHRKGYVAQPGPERDVPDDGPIPLASDSDVHGHVQKPDQSHSVGPSGSRGGSSNERVMGADR
jgi:hypothetical protein